MMNAILKIVELFSVVRAFAAIYTYTCQSRLSFLNMFNS